MLNKTKIQIGIAPIGWTNDDMPELGGEIPFTQCIKEMYEAGFTGCEIGSKFPRDPKNLLNALKPYKLRIASQWFSSYFTTEEDPHSTISAFKDHISFLKAVGAKIVVVSEQGGSIQGDMKTPIFGNKPTLSPKKWDKLQEGLNAIGQIAQQMGMKIAYHHHMGTVVQNYAEIQHLMNITDPSLVYLLADTGHMVYAGGDPIQLLTDYSDRIVHIHLKDVRIDIIEKVRKEELSFLEGVKLGTFTVPGDGDIDFLPIFNTIGQIEYEGWLVVEAEQDPALANPLKYAKLGRATIKDLGGI